MSILSHTGEGKHALSCNRNNVGGACGIVYVQGESYRAKQDDCFLFNSKRKSGLAHQGFARRLISARAIPNLPTSI